LDDERKVKHKPLKRKNRLGQRARKKLAAVTTRRTGGWQHRQPLVSEQILPGFAHANTAASQEAIQYVCTN
jgi:hypothetical protein